MSCPQPVMAFDESAQRRTTDSEGDGCEQAPELQRRKSRRLSGPEPGTENCAPTPSKGKGAVAVGANHTPSAQSHGKTGRALNRFGFKKRALTVVAVGGGAGGAALADGAPADGGLAAGGRPIDLVALADSTMGDFEEVSKVLRLKMMGSSWEFKAKIAELQEHVRTLKSALSEQIKRGRRLKDEVLAPVAEEVNGRLRSLAEEAAGQRSLADRVKDELVGVKQRCEERGRKNAELREAAVTRQKELEAHERRADAEKRRADDTTARLTAAEGELKATREALEALRTEHDAQGTAAAAAATAAATEAERLAAALAERGEALEAAKRDGAQREAELSGARDTHTARADAAEAKLAEASANLDRLRGAHEALTQTHASMSETAAATRAKLEAVEGVLEEKSATLSQKDEDLRESIRTVTQLQRDNSDMISHERQRAASLEDEARTLRAAAAEAEKAREAAQGELGQCSAQLEAARVEIATSQAALVTANEAREKLTIESVERRDALIAKEEANASLAAALAESQEQLATATATRDAKREECDALSRSKHEVEVEYRSYQEHHGSSNQQQMAAISELKLTVDRLSHQVESKSTEVSATQGSLAEQTAYLATLESKLREQESLRRALHNTIQELKGNIRVFCRVRPAAAEAPRAIEASGHDAKLQLSHASSTHDFSFDKVFGASASQPQIFEEVDGLVQSSLDGYKVCIFAYGQTGSGKTFTMQGGVEPASWGIIPRALSKILSLSEAMRSEGWAWTLSASFLEIYNESLRDLLHSGKEAQPSYAIKHDEAWGTVVANMSRVDVASMDQINALMARAAKQRAVGSTDMNAQSSRSHSVFALYLKGVNEKLNTELHGALHLVDLAGSERLDKSGAVGAALKETQAINKSLSSLADVFASKAAGNSHVPFRNSKLTHLMEPCLSGHGKTLMLVNVAPEADNSHESLCSLRFAKQVNQCDTGTGGGQKPKRSAKAPPPATAPASKAARPQGGAAAPSKRPATAK